MADASVAGFRTAPLGIRVRVVDESLYVLDCLNMKNDEVHTRIDVLLPPFSITTSNGSRQRPFADTVSDALDEGRSEGDGAIDHPIAIHDIQMNPINPCRNCFVHRLATAEFAVRIPGVII